MRILWLTSLMFFFPVSAQAFDCEFFTECCWGGLTAYEEAGSPSYAVEALETGCDAILAMPESLRHGACAHAWESISIDLWNDYQRGIIGFYPDSCLAGVDEYLEDDPFAPEADPEGEGL